jgi:glyoxylase-like metal-dependent hydrolase (beta-lactamase superfamily II)
VGQAMITRRDRRLHAGCGSPTRFPGGVGKTRGNAANFTSLINDGEHKLFDRLPDETWFCAGHGRDSTLGAQRPSVPEWRAGGR